MVAGRQRLSPSSARPTAGVATSRRGEPERTCIGCRRKAGQSELLRVVRRADGSLAVGRTLPGRGAWLCRGRPACLAEAARRRAFGRALRGPLASDAVERLAVVLAAQGD